MRKINKIKKQITKKTDKNIYELIKKEGGGKKLR